MSIRMYRSVCWVMAAANAVATFCAVLSTSPTMAHRIWVAATVAFLGLFNAWLWSIQNAVEAKAA